MESEAKAISGRDKTFRDGAIEAKSFNVKKASVDAALHQMNQNITILLITLDYAKLMGKLLPEDIDLLLDSSLKLRDSTKLIRTMIENGNN